MFVFLKQNPTSLLGVWMHVLKKIAKSHMDSYLSLILDKDSKSPFRFLGCGSYSGALRPCISAGMLVQLFPVLSYLVC